MPAEAEQSCRLPRSPYASIEELEAVNRLRGLAILECDSRRALAVSTHRRQLAAMAEQARIREDRRRPWWKIWE